MRVLVTGAHGFVGSHAVDALLARGHAVRGLVSPWGRTTNLASAERSAEFEIVRADLSDPDAPTGTCDGVDAVLHAAARVADWGPEADFERVNVAGTRSLLDEAVRAGAPRFVLVSSVAVHRYAGFRDADAEARPRDGGFTAYARSKIAAEDLVRAYHASGAIEGVIARPGLWPHGPRDPNLARIAAALRSGAFPLVDGGRATLNVAGVANLAEALARCVEAPGAAGRALVLADEGAPTWREALSELADRLGAPRPRLSLPGALVAPLAGAVEGAWAALAPRLEPPLTRYRAELMRRDVHFDLAPTREALGWTPPRTWREGFALSAAALALPDPPGSAPRGPAADRRSP